jgi:hypothetical protein
MKTPTQARPGRIELIELLEPRITPSNVLAVVSGHTLKITGTTGDDSVVITEVTGSAYNIVPGVTGDTVNGQTSGVSFPTSITGISIALSDGNDSVAFSNGLSPIVLTGNVTIAGGHGSKTIGGADVTIGGNFTILNGDAGTGTNTTGFSNLQVNGSMTVISKGGNTNLSLSRTSGGISSINKNFAVSNGVGADLLTLQDMNIGGMVTVNNGLPNATFNAGSFNILNSVNANFPSQFGKSISVTFLEGGSEVNISDAVVAGNVAINTGNVNAGTTIQVDGSGYQHPVTIHGGLSISGAFANVFLGVGISDTGVNIGKSVSITSKLSEVYFRQATVLGATNIVTSATQNDLFIEDSLFAGPFSFNAGKGGNNELEIETEINTTLPTLFEKTVFIDLGHAPASAPSTLIDLAGAHDASQVIEFDSTFTVLAAAGSTPTIQYDHLESPFGIIPVLP